MTTTATPSIGASSAASTWDAIDWQSAEKQVRRLQMRIAKATREGRRGKVKALQWLLTHSLSRPESALSIRITVPATAG